MSTGEHLRNPPSNSPATDSGSSSTTLGTPVNSLSADLPSSSFDGTHLQGKQFRHDVLAAHRIRVLESPPSYPLPESLIALIEATSADVGRFQQQRLDFRDQVTQGRGFGPSPIFPPNLLPTIDHERQLARCMVPCFSREALPERISDHKGPLYELSVPRSGLGCGFSSDALTADELSKIPQFLVASGTVVEFNTGYVSSGVSLYTPFLVFERTFGKKEHRLEAANNQCAIAGAWCTRSLELLYARAWPFPSPGRPDLPVSFSCTIDNDLAIINYHWISDAEWYCMSPVCKFDLTNDEHFDQFSIWIEAIGQWGLRTLLPNIKNALSLVAKASPSTSGPVPHKPTKLRLDTGREEAELLTALKTTFNSIPWRTGADDLTPVSSSIASCGSPINGIMFDSTVEYPYRSHSDNDDSGAVTTGKIPEETSQRDEAPATPTLSQKEWKPNTPQTPQALEPIPEQIDATPDSEILPMKNEMNATTFPKPTVSIELVWQKRFGHAMDEIQHLQTDLEQLRETVNGSSTNLRKEISGIRGTISRVLRKETKGSRTCNPPSSIPGTWSYGESGLFASRQPTELHFLLSPVDASPRSYDWDLNQRSLKRTASRLRRLMTVDTSVANTIRTRSTPCSPVVSSPAQTVKSDTTDVIVVPPGPPKLRDIFKLSTVLLSTHVIGSFIPSTVLRIAFLGCVTEFAMLAWASPHWPSSVAYFCSLIAKNE